MFDGEMFKFDVALIPQAKALYDTLGVPHEPLTLIPPQVPLCCAPPLPLSHAAPSHTCPCVSL